ncbi:MAG: glucosaminidase domain-containing protein [Cetobacterium sp.]|uniref:glucosaminidase domain-containing protein n=1 Tax=Cetobacterium sp. TaxID=2071632 RepID=UPI002FC881CB
MRKLSIFILASTIFVSSFSKDFTSLLGILDGTKHIESTLNSKILPKNINHTNNSNLNKQVSEIKGKQTFIKNIVPIIKSVEDDIAMNKVRVASLSKKSTLTLEEKTFLTNIFDKYRVSYGNFASLMDKMIMPPTSLIVAQASLESGWGTSKISSRSNNLFGMKSFSKNEPRVKADDSLHYRKYENVKESVYDYVINLSRHNAYKSLRKGIKNGEDSTSLTKYLTAYCEQGDYKDKLNHLIKSNNFKKFDV